MSVFLQTESLEIAWHIAHVHIQRAQSGAHGKEGRATSPPFHIPDAERRQQITSQCANAMNGEFIQCSILFGQKRVTVTLQDMLAKQYGKGSQLYRPRAHTICFRKFLQLNVIGIQDVDVRFHDRYTLHTRQDICVGPKPSQSVVVL